MRSCNHCCRGKSIIVTYSKCVCVCPCSLSYPACNAHAPYCHPWPVQLYNIIRHYLINSTIFEGKTLLNMKCVLIISTTFVWNISHSKKNSGWYNLKCTNACTYSTRYYCQILMELRFSQKIFKTYRNIKSHEDPSSGRRDDPFGKWVDGQDEADSLFSQFSKRA